MQIPYPFFSRGIVPQRGYDRRVAEDQLVLRKDYRPAWARTFTTGGVTIELVSFISAIALS